MRKSCILIASLLAAALQVPRAAIANPVAFTWNPAGSVPALGGPASGFSADQTDFRTYLRSVIAPGGTFAIDEILPISGFRLHGLNVPAPGLGTAYGLYFEVTGTGALPVGKPPVYFTLNVSLMGDPGNQNGIPHSDLAGIGFANTGPTGTADDVLLGGGSLLKASMATDPVPFVRHADYLVTFASAAGEEAFFGSGLTTSLQLLLTTTPDKFQGPPIIRVNDAFGVAAFVPEPASLALFAAGCAGIAFARRRGRCLGLH